MLLVGMPLEKPLVELRAVVPRAAVLRVVVLQGGVVQSKDPHNPHLPQ
jgi:hypothetical protein